MELLIVFVVYVALVVVPVMIGARIVGAKHQGFGTAFVAVLALAIVNGLVRAFFGYDLLGTLLSIGLGTLVLAQILGTTFLKALAVSIIAFLIMYGVVLVVALLLAGVT